MERLTMTSAKGGVAFTFDLDITCEPSEARKILRLAEKLKKYEDAEEQGTLLRLDSKDELIEVLARKLLNEQFGACYMCKNLMKNITLDGVNNGCDGECNLSEEHTVDDFLKKIVGELERKRQSGH